MHSLIVSAALCTAAVSTCFSPAGAQSSQAPVTPNNFARAAANLTSDLTFPVEAEPASAITTPRMAMLEPEGTGPFPAIVLVHQCSGLNATLLQWAKEAIARGYVVLL